MAVNNSLAAKTDKRNSQAMVYMAGDQQITITPQIVRDYFVSGDKERVSLQEIVMYMNLCKYSGLNPWQKEAYCIKYGNEPATMVAGKAAFLKRADMNPNYDGMESGVIVVNPSTGISDYRKGAFYLPGENIVGGWADVYRKDRSYPTRIEVSFEEYAQRKSDGSLNKQWKSKPGTMIRKVAQVQALREAFPRNFEGMYAAEEMGVEEPDGMPIQPQEPAPAPEPDDNPAADVLFEE